MLVTRPADRVRWDQVSLGEVMLRLDPGESRIATTRTFQAWEGGGEYNVARGLRRCFGLRTSDRHRPRRQPGRAPPRGPHAPGRGRPVPRDLAALRRGRAVRPERPELHRARIRGPGGAGLLGSRAHGRLPAGARRHRLGRHLRRRGRPLVPHRWDLRGPVGHDPRGRPGGDGGRPAARHGRLVRPELPAVAVERGRRSGASAGGQSPARRPGRRPHRQRGGLHGRARLRRPRRRPRPVRARPGGRSVG